MSIIIKSNSELNTYVEEKTSTLDECTDTNLGTPTDGQALVYDDATSKWISGTAGIGEYKSSSIAISSDGTALEDDDESDNQNIGIGTNTLCKTDAEYKNIAIGAFAAEQFKSSVGADPSLNTAIGAYALRGLDTGTSNTAIGFQAGMESSGDKISGNYSVYIGNEGNTQSYTRPFKIGDFA